MMSQGGSGPPKPHPGNVPGDFYVEDGCCTACGVMHGEALDLLGWTDDARYPHCSVTKQPTSPDGLGRMLRAVAVSDLGCLRYRGSDPGIRRRLAEMGGAAQSDVPPPAGVARLVRSHVTFRAVAGMVPISTMDLAQSFIQHDGQRYLDYTKAMERIFPDRKHAGHGRRVEATLVAGHQDSIKVSWSDDPAKAVRFDRQPDGRWLVVCSGIGWDIEDWLWSNDQLEDARWFSAEQWKAGGPYLPTVF